MAYKIVNFDSATATITVCYDDAMTLAFQLPVDENNNVPAGEALDTYLQKMEPTVDLERIAKLASNGVANADAVQTLVSVDPTQTDPILSATVPNAKQYAVLTLNNAVGLARQKFLALPYGQEFSNDTKWEQAFQFKARSYADPVPSYIAAEISITKETPQVCTDAILQEYTNWVENIDPKIEAIRSVATRNILAATDVATIKTVYDRATLSLNAFLDANKDTQVFVFN